jgi:hypothetical protein
MTTVAGIFISAPRDGQIYVAERYIGTIKDGGNIDHDYSGSGLAHLYETARRKFTARPTSATILQFPNGEKLGNA